MSNECILWQKAKNKAGSAKLTKAQVIEIRTYKNKLPSRKVAVLFSISKTNVLDIWKNKIWKEQDNNE